mmetsp:Transcript_22863/g.35788  ORF Transcript_22863/g.35788 Transcript_22863/m.35788 type:complete len:97 (-) Transcript_22863:187-477(-)
MDLCLLGNEEPQKEFVTLTEVGAKRSMEEAVGGPQVWDVCTGSASGPVSNVLPRVLRFDDFDEEEDLQRDESMNSNGAVVRLKEGVAMERLRQIVG